MCDLVSVVLGVASSLYSGMAAQSAAKKQAEIQRAQAENQARVLEQNAAQARSEAEAVIAAGNSEEKKLRENVRRVRGAQDAAFGASGLSLNSGTPVSVAVDTEVQGEEDAGLLRKNYARKAFGLRNEASAYDWQASESRNLGNYSANAIRNAGNSSMVASLLGAAGTVASKWDSLRSLGNKSKSTGVTFSLRPERDW
mgnify:CR=1 FL=1